jgi:tetratricopeptide (TPR) repeat protein
MTQIRQYDYSNTAQRSIFTIIAFLFSVIAGALFSIDIRVTNELLPYNSGFVFAGLCFFFLHMLGFLAGKFLFRSFAFPRTLFIFSGTMLCGLSGFLLLKAGVAETGSSQIAGIIVFNTFKPAGLLVLIPFLWGFLNSFILKVTCGIFFDEKRGGAGFILALASGFAAGYSVSRFVPGKPFDWAVSAAAAAAVFMMIFVRAKYSPKPFLAQNIGDTVQPDEEESARLREDLFFTYLNFSSIILYLFIAGNVLPSFYGDTYGSRDIFFILIFPSAILGFCIPYFIRTKWFHFFYIEMAYPFLFGGWFLTVFTLHEQISLLTASFLFAPAAVVFGASFHFSIKSVLAIRDQTSSSDVIGFSLFVLPVPILVALGFVPMTWTVFLVIFYLSTILNIGVPVIFNAQRRLSEFRRIVYFAFVVISVFLFVFVHLYFKIPFSNTRMAKKSSGIENVLAIGFTSDYTPKSADAFFNGLPAFHSSNQTIRSLNQTVSIVSLFADYKNDRVLFIDGNHSFFANTAESCFKNALRIDYVPKLYSGYQRVSVSSRREIATEDENILRGLRSANGVYSVIVDMPNLYDPGELRFRFSPEYLSIMKSRLSGKKIYAVVINSNRGNKTVLGKIRDSFAKEFPFVTVFRFGEYVMIIGSENSGSLLVNEGSVKGLKDLLGEDQKLATLFASENQCFSNIVFSGRAADLKDDVLIVRKANSLPAEYLKINNAGLGIVSPASFKAQIQSYLSSNDRILTLLKQIEENGIAGDFETETKNYLELKKTGEYNPALRQYSLYHIGIRESVFRDTAVSYEKEKMWEDASKIYKAILVLNPNDFDVNYRMSVISLTLQDIQGSSDYLKKAMSLQPNNPNVMHQMGVILFSTGKYSEAIEYLMKAIALQKSDSSTYYYLGICYEELGRFPEAQQNYDSAIQKDPSNPDIIAAAGRLKQKMKKQSEQWQAPEQKNQNELEKGENFPLPINKSAIDVRLKDDDAEKK